MAKEKRTKPCCNCKRSKVRCVYESSLPCQRCLKTGQAPTCQFVPKLPSLKIPDIDSITQNQTRFNNGNVPSATLDRNIHSNNNVPPSNIINPYQPQPQVAPQPQYPQQSPQFHKFSPQYHQQLPHYHQNPPPQAQNDSSWKSSIEQTLHSFDNKINSLVDLLKTNHSSQHTLPLPSVHVYPAHNLSTPSILPSISNLTADPSISKKRPIEEPLHPNKQRKKPTVPKDFREGYITLDEANELFRFFNDKISQQLFGFEISKLSISELWHTCPILVCTICAIASIHHPQLKDKSDQLQIYLRELCNSIFFENKPRNINEGFNVIIALILCSFWLSDSQMFTGLALQLAKEFGLDQPQKNKDYLKLWYLLYVLDGQQSLTFNRQPLVNPKEYSLKNSRKILIENKHLKFKKENLLANQNKSIKVDLSDEEIEAMMQRQKLTDLRLVSQVEYNQALNEAFKGDAWDLLVPSSFGIPSKSNLELDKWMVSWTVLLAPGNYGAVWSTKSTLIYYNFAKMHINSNAVRKLTMNPNDINGFPKWDNSLEDSTIKVEVIEDETDDSDTSDSDDDEESKPSLTLIPHDDALINANIAFNAAQTVLTLVINDNDIVDNLKYVPVHIHIMLYYAALLLLNPIKSNIKEYEYYMKLIEGLKILSLLKKKIYSNLPIDTKFGNKLIKSLEDIETEKLSELKQYIDSIENVKVKEQMSSKMSHLIEISENIEELSDSCSRSGRSSRSATPLPEKISAWPGSNHGHP